MFYRVDYLLTLIAAGFVLGALFGKSAERLPAPRLARIFYFAFALLAAIRIATYVFSAVANPPGFVGVVGALAGDLSNVAFGAAFGLALRRKDARGFLTDSALLDAFFLSLAFTYVLAGVAKAFAMKPMTEFFTQSGYSTGFLKFIDIAEIFGGMALLLPWARIPAWFGLMIDMFGAVLTHIHNGDPLNDSSGAIVLLIKLVAIAMLFGLSQRHREPQLRVAQSAYRTAAATALCLCIAFGGSVALRHSNPTAAASSGIGTSCLWSYVTPASAPASSTGNPACGRTARLDAAPFSGFEFAPTRAQVQQPLPSPLARRFTGTIAGATGVHCSAA